MDFQERFKGRTTMMSKEGITAIVKDISETSTGIGKTPPPKSSIDFPRSPISEMNNNAKPPRSNNKKMDTVPSGSYQNTVEVFNSKGFSNGEANNPYLIYNPLPSMSEDAHHQPMPQYQRNHYQPPYSQPRPSPHSEDRVPANFYNANPTYQEVMLAAETSDNNFPRSNPRKPPLSKGNQGVQYNKEPISQAQQGYGRKGPTKVSSANREKDILINSSANIIGNHNNTPNHYIRSRDDEPLSPKANTGESFKPYTLKEYKERVKTNTYTYGGLGANIMTDEWFRKREKAEKMADFADQVKMRNTEKFLERLENDTGDYLPTKGKKPTKEPSKRERAIEFAKSVPKPKLKPRDVNENEEAYAAEAFRDNELEKLEREHRKYKDEIEKMKAK